MRSPVHKRVQESTFELLETLRNDEERAGNIKRTLVVYNFFSRFSFSLVT